MCRNGVRPRDDPASPPSGSGKDILSRLMSNGLTATSRVISKITESFKSSPPVPAPRAVIKSDEDDEVHCARCTYINTPHALVCGMCGGLLNDVENTAQETIALSPVSSVEGEDDGEWKPPKPASVSSSARQTTLKRKFVSSQVPAPPVHDLTDAKYAIYFYLMNILCTSIRF